MAAVQDITRCRLVDPGVVPYRRAFDAQKREVERIQRAGGDETLFLLEHPHVITLGRNATGAALATGEKAIAARGMEVVATDRGGDATYHGPGQLVGYPIIRLETGRRDVRRYVHDLEEVLIRTLADFGVQSRRHPVHRGVWVETRKIASLGVRISRWVTCHGFALNVNTDLDFYDLITPCGIAGCEMTSMAVETGSPVDMIDVKSAVASHFASVYDRTVVVPRVQSAVGG